MSTIRRVLFPIDFSLGCQILAPTVRMMIELWHAEVTLLHVIEDRNWRGRYHDLERPMAQMEAIAQDAIYAPRVRRRIERGSAAGCILQYIRLNHIDLVVIPARGSTALHRSPLGSVADEILKEAPCPVWLDWGAARSSLTPGMQARRVCCALELGESDEHVLHEAAAFTMNLGASLTVVHAVSPMPGRPLALLRDGDVRQREFGSIERHIERLRRRYAPSADVKIEVGSSETVVSRTIRAQSAGLLVTGHFLEAIMAARSECPVLRLAPPASSAVPLMEPEPRYADAAQRSA
jgi:nucleotide-binding universal stress UspA family protein